MKRTSAKGIQEIKESEGLKLVGYPDPATGGKPYTAGYGHTGSDVSLGVKYTQAQADAWLAQDLAKFEAGVNKLAPVTTQGQFDALVSFAYNLGIGNLQSSTLLKKHNAGDYAGTALEFSRWNKAAGKVMSGLTARRAREAELYKS